jgi:hypothetical protein
MGVSKSVLVWVFAVAVCSYGEGLDDYGVETEKPKKHFIKVSMDVFDAKLRPKPSIDAEIYEVGYEDYSGTLYGDVNGFTLSYGKLSPSTIPWEILYSYRGGDMEGSMSYKTEEMVVDWWEETQSQTLYADSEAEVSEHEFRGIFNFSSEKAEDMFSHGGIGTVALNLRNIDRTDTINDSSADSTELFWSERSVDQLNVTFLFGGAYIAQARISRFSVGVRADLEVGFAVTYLEDSVGEDDDSGGFAYRAKASVFGDIDLYLFSVFGELGGLSHGISSLCEDSNMSGTYGRAGVRVMW